MCTGAITDAPRPPHAADTSTDPVWATSASRKSDGRLRCFVRRAFAGPAELAAVLPIRSELSQVGRVLHENFSRWEFGKHVPDGGRARPQIREQNALRDIDDAFFLKALEQIRHRCKNLSCTCGCRGGEKARAARSECARGFFRGPRFQFEALCFPHNARNDFFGIGGAA